MSDPGAEFARSLVEAGKTEQLPAGAAGRAVRQLALAIPAPAAASTLSLVSTGGWTIGAVVALAAAVGIALSTQRERATATAPTATVVAPPPSSSPPVTDPTSPPLAAQPAAPSRGSLCERVELPDYEPTVCSQSGHEEAIQIVNTCGDPVDLFWVDFKCRETFVARLAPGETIDHRTYDTHPWRVRDHATHKLIKEWVGPRLPDPPDKPVPLPDVVIRDGMSMADSTPSVCSRNGNQALLRFVNRRTSGVSVVFWVDYQCREQVVRRMEPGETWTPQTFDTHPFRVRDERGALLMEFVPDGVDQTVYVSLP
jgi:hypothetical protein